MKCPICTVDLVMSERQGVEIDYCPKCRGVWLDRGELDKIIEKSVGGGSSEYFGSSESHNSIRRNDDHHDDHDHGNFSSGHKKKGMLGELFDF